MGTTLKRPFWAISGAGGSKLVEQCGIKVEQVRAHQAVLDPVWPYIWPKWLEQEWSPLEQVNPYQNEAENIIGFHGKTTSKKPPSLTHCALQDGECLCRCLHHICACISYLSFYFCFVFVFITICISPLSALERLVCRCKRMRSFQLSFLFNLQHPVLSIFVICFVSFFFFHLQQMQTEEELSTQFPRQIAASSFICICIFFVFVFVFIANAKRSGVFNLVSSSTWQIEVY